MRISSKNRIAHMLVVALACLMLHAGPCRADEDPAGAESSKNQAADENSRSGFTPLFDGKSLEGWKVMSEKSVPDDEWSVRDGILVAKPGWSWLSTTQMYGDFILRLEWRIPENGNSGVFIRVPRLKAGEHPYEEGIEIQVLDDHGSEYAGKLQPGQYTGSLYAAVPAENSTYRGANRWNSFEITCRGEHIQVVMNGRQVAQANVAEVPALRTRPRRGFIGLQNHGSRVEYRNLLIKPLGR